MTTDECQELCEAAGLNVKMMSLTPHSLIATTAPERRSAQSVMARLRKLAAVRGFAVMAITFSQAPHSDDEYSFRV